MVKTMVCLHYRTGIRVLNHSMAMIAGKNWQLLRRCYTYMAFVESYPVEQPITFYGLSVLTPVCTQASYTRTWLTIQVKEIGHTVPHFPVLYLRSKYNMPSEWECRLNRLPGTESTDCAKRFRLDPTVTTTSS